MRNSITENEIEEIALSYLKNLGYFHILGPDISPDGEHPERHYNEVVLTTRLRDAIDVNATVKTAFNQIQTYKQAIPSLFTYNELLIASDGWDALCGTFTSDWGRFMSWKTKDGRTTADTLQPQLEVMFTGMLNKQTLLNAIITA
jgi:type I site-specific restriction-modification system R (restriction) subunit